MNQRNIEYCFENLQISSFYFKEQSPESKFGKYFFFFFQAPKIGITVLTWSKEKQRFFEFLFILSLIKKSKNIFFPGAGSKNVFFKQIVGPFYGNSQNFLMHSEALRQVQKYNLKVKFCIWGATYNSWEQQGMCKINSPKIAPP